MQSIIAYVLSLVVAGLAVGLPDLAGDRALAFANHDEGLETQLLLVGESSLVSLVLEAFLFAAVKHVHDAVDLARLLAAAARR